MPKLVSPFKRLQGKMTIFYMINAVLAFLVVEIILVGGALLISVPNLPLFASGVLTQEVPQATTYFVHGSPDGEALARWLTILDKEFPSKQGPFSFARPLLLAVVDIQGHVLASSGRYPLVVGTQFPDQLSSRDRANWRIARADVRGAENKFTPEGDGSLLGMAAITDQHHVDGVLVVKVVAPDNWQLALNFLQFLALSVVIITLYAAVAGGISGYVTARGLTRRLQGLVRAAERWSRGDFSSYVHDSSEDELGQATQQFNHMAGQLRQLLQVRQKVATLEERNRLARDLHDSVKQQVFAAAMQIGAVRFLLRQDIDAAEKRLLEAEKLVRQAQQELTSLIRELRPAALEGKGLVAAIRELTTQWTQQTGIVANVRIGEMQILALTVEEALFRVTQEALANVARHSHATLVQVSLEVEDDLVTLTVRDNGQGFAVGEEHHPGIGLSSMQERMRHLGGDVQVESVAAKGVCIVARCKRLLQDAHIEPAEDSAEHASGGIAKGG
ncbi:sensor histidine kinase [Ktedonobacter racemifer]|nr:sensor histidine kinase [Ktedonobacter racemifer]